MSDLPLAVETSGLWKLISTNSDLATEMVRLRSSVELIASKIAEQIPEFTDHSIKHFDALWSVADQIIAPSEMALLSIGEAFILGGSLYIHDLGMAICATNEGEEQVKNSDAYKSIKIRLEKMGEPPSEASKTALKQAARILHAETAISFATEKIPGLDRYLIENSEIRHSWGEFIGYVAASHHWSIADVDKKLGVRGSIPDAIGGNVDLAYIACLLRVIDFAHINMDRASSMEKLLRSNLPDDSMLHWKAQENITGPRREANQLIYSSTRAIADVNAWWTFYEMIKGLDVEINGVFEYLSTRTVSATRWTLEGVKFSKSPQKFSHLVPTDNFEPVDIRFRPDSMERLIGILGGRTLYGNDHFAPIRELLQNAKDAISLQTATNGDVIKPQINVTLFERDGNWNLSISDNGIGMSSNVLTNYLLGIASDYWHSSDFYNEHSSIVQKGFKPVGRFGIGFLSVFMLGDSIEVQTQKIGAQNLTLQLHGIGQRGSLVKKPSQFLPGTTVTVKLENKKNLELHGLAQIILAKAPMLDIDIRVTDSENFTEINKNWWKNASQSELIDFLRNQQLVSTTPHSVRESSPYREAYSHRMKSKWEELPKYSKWPEKQPEFLTDNCRVIAIPNFNNVLLCSKGFAIRMIEMSGMCGVINVDDIELDATRSQTLDKRWESPRESWLNSLRNQIIESINDLIHEGDIPARFEFLISVVKSYGKKLLLETTLPWITLRERPGNTRLISVDELSKELASKNEAFITYNVSPWASENESRRGFPLASKECLILPVSSIGQPDIGSYDDKDIYIEGDFAQHFESKILYERLGKPEDAVLLNATIQSVAKAWGENQDEMHIVWKRYKRKLFGHLIRQPK